MGKGLFVPDLSNFDKNNKDSVEYNFDAIADVIKVLKAQVSVINENIDSLESQLETMSASIETNASGVATNASGVATNAEDIATNVTAIETNATDIATNASDIADNSSDIADRVVGPASSTNNVLARFNGTTGKIVQNGSTIEDDAGNVGVGRIPEPWDSTLTGVDIGGTGSLFSETAEGTSKSVWVMQNIYNDGDFKRKVNDEATAYRQIIGKHIWYSDASDTANTAFTPTQVMKLEVGGYLELYNIRSGATQAAAGASASEFWKTSGHATLPDNVVMIGV